MSNTNNGVLENNYNYANCIFSLQQLKHHKIIVVLNGLLFPIVMLHTLLCIFIFEFVCIQIEMSRAV